MSIYNEDKVFVLPNIKEGVSALDLWDCRESKYLNINLFKENLSAVHLKASQISDMEYNLMIYYFDKEIKKHKITKFNNLLFLENKIGAKIKKNYVG